MFTHTPITLELEKLIGLIKMSLYENIEISAAK